MASEDITFCANISCSDMKCERNMKHIKQPIPHSFALFTKCRKWKKNGALWLTNQIDGGHDVVK